ncbi:MAG: hypothetical protein MUC87_15240 [Bacteroidia bacterium]|jgi:ribosomal protein L37E|nr:hypothetical protein [Bacteroidia bacterium]
MPANPTSSARRGDPRRHRTLEVNVTDRTTCYICGLHPFPADDVYCGNCGFPQRGTPDERYKFVLKRRQLRSQLREAESDIGSARRILMFIAIAYLVGSIFVFGSDSEISQLSRLLTGGALLGLWFYSKTKPVEALLSALLLYIVMMAISFLGDPFSILVGLLMKIIPLAALIFGYQSARKAIKIKAQFDPATANSLLNDRHK